MWSHLRWKTKHQTALRVPNHSYQCGYFKMADGVCHKIFFFNLLLFWYVTKAKDGLYLQVVWPVCLCWPQTAWLTNPRKGKRSISCRTIFSAVIVTLSYLIVKLKKIKILFQSSWLNTALRSLPTALPTKIVFDIGGSSWCNVDCCFDNFHTAFAVSGNAMIGCLISS